MLLSFCSALRVYHYNETESYVYMVINVILIFIVISQIIRIRQNIYRYFNRIEHSLEQSKCFTLFNIPEPVVITDKSGKILWYNRSFFLSISNGADAFGMNICEELNADISELRDGNQFTLEYQDKKYSIKCTVNTGYNIEMKILYFNDVTAYLDLVEEYSSKKPTVAIIAVDNYDDMFQNVKESERSIVQSKMEKTLENLTADSGSFLKRLSKDRFLVVFEEQHLSKIIKERFKILDEARTISVGDELCVTLSIGVGSCSNSLAESELYAREALDMALGRGGDQAAVKTEDGFKFFGGMSKGIEKHSRIKTRIVSNAMQKLVDNASEVFIMGHRFGDFDAIGAAIGLSAALDAIGKTSYIVVDPQKNLAKDVIERAKKNLNFITETQALDLADNGSLLIVVDTHKRDMVESPELLKKIKNLIVIDHHRKNVNFIDNAMLFYHEPFASSASEMVAEVIPYFKNLSKIPSFAADALLAGIMLDTKNFIIKTSVRTFEAAAYLKKMGADTVSVRSLFANSIEFYRLKSEIVSSAELINGFAVATAKARFELIDSLRIIAPQAADELMNISSVMAAFVLYETNEVVNISARSYGAVNVQLIMEKIHGGGHQTMAATQLNGVSVEDAKKMLFNAIEIYKLENMTDTKLIDQKGNQKK